MSKSELQPPQSLGQVMAMMESDQSLSCGQRRDMVSALRTLARIIGQDIGTIPAQPKWIAAKLRHLSPQQAGISEKTFANIKSSAMAALRLTGATELKAIRNRPITPEWQTLMDMVDDEHERIKLIRFVKWCGAKGVSPSDVTDTTVIEFHQEFVERSLAKEPKRTISNAVRVWNKLSRKLPRWPKVELAKPWERKRVTFDWSDFPQSFQDDVQAWVSRISAPHPLDEDGPARPLRPLTVKQRKYQIQLLASALRHQGHPAEAIISLAYLVSIDNFKTGLRHFLDQAGGKSTDAIHSMAIGLKAVAQHHVRVGQDHLDQLRRICTRLNPQIPGLREKNRERLAQFDHTANLALLLHLPQHLIRAAAKPGSKPRSAPLLLQAAAAIEILLYAPMRIGNLASLTLDQHLRWVTVDRADCLHISIPADEVKNRKPLHYELGPDSSAVVRKYLDDGRPVLMGAPTNAVFPALDGGCKLSVHLSAQISNAIFEHTGLKVNPHLFRSLAGKLHSMVSPGDMVTLSHVLNDALNTVAKSYAQFETRTSMRHYQASVHAMRLEHVANANKVALRKKRGG